MKHAKWRCPIHGKVPKVFVVGGDACCPIGDCLEFCVLEEVRTEPAMLDREPVTTSRFARKGVRR